MLRRMYTPTGMMSSPSTKGTRQPQACSASSESTDVSSRPSEAPSSAATPWLMDCQLTKKPRWLAPADSSSSVVAEPTSPPAAKPCSRRPATMSTGAITPICACVGAKAMSAVPSPISAMVASMAALRPLRSAYAPNTMLPSGRMTKPTPNTATAMSSEP